MTIAEYRKQLERRIADADAMNATAPVADVLRAVLRELSELVSVGVLGGRLTTEQVGTALGVKPKTVAHWAASGRFPGASKTPGKKGRWTIPSDAILSESANARKRPKLLGRR